VTRYYVRVSIYDVSLHVICHQFITYAALYRGNKQEEPRQSRAVAAGDLGAAAY
jgi:hypothetical protein